MDLQPDQLFRDKLLPFASTPPQSVWERVEKARKRRGHKRYFMIAASILLVIVAGIALLRNSSESRQNEVVAVPVIKTETIEPEESSVGVEIIDPEEVKQVIASKSGPQKANARVDRKVEVPDPIVKNASSPVLVVDPNELIDSNQMALDLAGEMTEPNAKTEEIKRSTVMIVYTRGEVNEKYLRKPLPADLEEELSTGSRQKLPEIASDIKYGNHGIGDLRQLKDDLLSLGFLADK